MKNLLPKLGFLTLLLFLVNGLFAQTCPTGMVSYHKFEETSSAVFDDAYGSNNAASDAALSSVPGIVGNAIWVDSNTVDIPSASSYNFPANSSFSIECWVKIPSLAPGQRDYVIISRGDYDVPGTYWSIQVSKTTGAVDFELRDANGSGLSNFTYISSIGSIEGNSWHHIVAVRDDAANKNYLYVDKTAYSTNYDYSGSFTSTAHTAVGYMMRGGVARHFMRGGIDEVIIYNRALTAAEVTDHNGKGTNGIGVCDGWNPKIISIAPNKATVGTAYTYDVNATGLPSITYTLATKPSGMTINQTTGVISWTPSSINTDGFVKVVATGQVAPADTQKFRIFLGQVEGCPTGLISLNKFDETSGPTYFDHYNMHNATALVAPSSVPGKIGNAQSFSNNTKVDIPDNGPEFEWAANASFTIELWLKTSSLGTQVAIGRSRNDPYARWYVGTDNGFVMFHLRDNSDPTDWVEIQSDDPIADGAWHHVVAVRDGAANMNKLIVDGVEKTQSHTYSHSFMADDPAPVTVGYLFNTGNEYHFNGSIDEVAIYSRAVPLSEITAYLADPTGHCAVKNYAPAITSVAKTAASQGTPYSYQFTVEDVDADDVIVLSAPTKPDWLTFNFTAGHKYAVLSGTPGNNNIGTFAVTLRVSDGTVQKDQSFNVVVANVNDEPIITSSPTTSVDEDAAYTYTLTVTDADVNDVINMSVVTKPSWLNFSYTAGQKTATLSGTPLNGDQGGTVTITITDGTATIQESYTLTVNAINDAPVITGQAEITVDEETVVTLDMNDLTVTDVDNQASDLSLEVLAGQHYTFINDVVTPDANFNGDLIVNVNVHDLDVASANFELHITYTPVNDAPVITSVPEDSVYMGNLYAYVLAATDVDNATLTYSVVQKPDWLGFSATSGVLTGTPQQANVGQSLVILRVSDGDKSADQSFILKVGGPLVGVSSFDAKGIKVYPVPARDFLNIRFDNLKQETYAEIISTNGSIVKKQIISKDQVNTTIDLGGIENGTYLLRLRNNEMNAVGRILINK
ncbi:MAG TPA: LamG-like jellyroll fold domain-containing protein [Bacteroidales bacterium]|nr:LamG-like jellyroll fold domain-containing protein [Bacteroidales bacterium]